MKIIYLTDQIYLHGGVEKVLSQKANYLADVQNEDVTIITYNQNGRKPCYTFSSKIQIIDIEINYNIKKSYFHPSNIKRSVVHIRALQKILSTSNADVVISCSIGPDFYFLPYICRQIPKIKEFHATRHFSSQLKSRKKLVLHKFSAIVEKAYSRLVILNEDELKYYPTGNVSVIPNPAEIDCQQSTLTNKKIIAAGRITYQKNFEDLIKIGEQIFKDFPEWQIDIYGDDYLGRKEILKKEILKAGLTKNIFFKGLTSDLKNTFLDYSIYAMTSNHETFPMVLLEALSVGLPVVSYDCPTGPSRILKNAEDSFLIPYKNINVFVEKIKILMEDEKRRTFMGQNGRNNVQRFSIDKVMTQWNSLFRNLIK